MPSLLIRWRRALGWRSGIFAAPFGPSTTPSACCRADRIRPSVRPRVIFQRVHVSPEQFGRIVISEQANRRRNSEKASTLRIAAKNFRRRGIEYELDSLLAAPWRFLRLLSAPVGLAVVRMGDVDKRKRATPMTEFSKTDRHRSMRPAGVSHGAAVPFPIFKPMVYIRKFVCVE
jgi:hypothetical protein